MAGIASADLPDVSFPSIDGGHLNVSDWNGRPVLVVNTASQCAYTGQYEELQALFDTYRADGLIVLAVPSDDFRQELGSAAEVKEFCEMTFGLDLPMTDITRIKGVGAHPLYRAVKAETGFVPRWNFNKILFASDGDVIATWGSRTSPMSAEIRRAVTDALSAR
ncbi:glutathione peroxidase [uncultured Tateyamaria sp.]|uniref:glutathione peroxidase n=1 Tax=uncultured Tateyamaria sp. TaxID=455651 RepID=UPI00260C96EF|nr:glutathione peroxidase [uncultured Tateyamaria sp.]